MNTYVNRFVFTANNFKEEVVLSFSQESPIFASDGEVTNVTVDPVANLVMNNRMARDLAEKLLAMLDSETPDLMPEDQ